MSVVRKSLVYLFAESYLGILMQLAGAAIIARLLSPTETGVFQVAAAFAAMASTFRDFGVAEYLIQKKDLDGPTLRRALGMNIILSWGIGVILLLASVPLARFYANDEIKLVMWILAANFLLIPFGAVTMAWHRRAMNFAPVFWSGLLSNVATFVIGVVLAYQGFGATSLAWGSFAGVVASVAVAMWFRPPEMPRLPAFTGLSEVIQFGKHATGIYLLGQIGKSAPEMIIGKVLSMANVAFFSRGGSLLELFNRTVLRSVIQLVLPYFAAEMRKGLSIARAYTRATAYLTGIGWPFLIFLAIIADEVILVLYGRQWTAAVRIGQLICVVGMIELVHVLSKEALIAVGRVERSNMLQLITQLARVIAIILSCTFGLEAIGYSLMIAGVIGLIAAQYELKRFADISLNQMTEAMRKSAWISIAVTLAVLASYRGMHDQAGAVSVIVVTGIVFSVTWLVAVYVTQHEVKAEIDATMRHIRERFF